MDRISSFKDLLNEIMYSWDWPNYELLKDEKGNFYLNKLYVTPDHASYKTQYWELAPGVFSDVERFYDFLENTKTHE